jgi:tRNA(Ile)-lysidine synthase TilS/MesJ
MKKLLSKTRQAINDFDMIQDGDKIAVCISGGKDSMLLAKCMEEFQKHGPIKFEVVYLCMNPGYSEKHLNKLISNAEILNIKLDMFNTDIFDIVHNIKDSPCYLCARMRRGYLYTEALKRGCNKIALGHHFDDVIETVLMSMLYGAEFKTMMPKLVSKNYDGIELIRPMYLVKEQSIISWAKYNELDFLQCACRFTEENYNQKESTSKRKEIKELITELRKKYSDVDINIFRSFHNVNLNTIVGYYNDEFTYNFLDDYDIKKKNSN